MAYKMTKFLKIPMGKIIEKNTSRTKGAENVGGHCWTL